MVLKNRRTQKNNINKRVQKRTKRKSLGKNTRKNLRKKRQNRKTRRRRFRGGVSAALAWETAQGKAAPPWAAPPVVRRGIVKNAALANDPLDSAINTLLKKTGEAMVDRETGKIIKMKDGRDATPYLLKFKESKIGEGQNMLSKRIKMIVNSTIQMYGGVNIGQILKNDNTFKNQGDLWDIWLHNMNECPIPKISSPMWDAKLIYLAIDNLTQTTPVVHYKKVFIVTDPLCAHINPPHARGGDVDDTVAAIYAICKLHEINGGEPVDLTFIVHCEGALERAGKFKKFLQHLISNENRSKFMNTGSVNINANKLYSGHPGINIDIVAFESGDIPFDNDYFSNGDNSLLFVNAPIKIKDENVVGFDKLLKKFSKVLMQGYDNTDFNMFSSSPSVQNSLLNRATADDSLKPDSGATFGYFTRDDMVNMENSIPPDVQHDGTSAAPSAAAAPSATAPRVGDAMSDITQTIIKLQKIEIKRILLYDIKVHLLGQACGLLGVPGFILIGFYFTTGKPFNDARFPTYKWASYKEYITNNNDDNIMLNDNKGNKLWSWWLTLNDKEEESLGVESSGRRRIAGAPVVAPTVEVDL